MAVVHRPGGGQRALQWRVISLEPLDLRLHFLGKTLGADAMAEMRVGSLRDVPLYRLPVIFIVADLLAVRADRKYALERSDFSKGVLEILHQLLANRVRPLFFGDVTGGGIDDSSVRVRHCIPEQPSIATVLAQVAVLKTERAAPGSNVAVLLEGASAIIRMYKFDERARHQLFVREAERAFPCGIELHEIAVEVEAAEHVNRGREESVFQPIIQSGRTSRHRQSGSPGNQRCEVWRGKASLGVPRLWARFVAWVPILFGDACCGNDFRPWSMGSSSPLSRVVLFDSNFDRFATRAALISLSARCCRRSYLSIRPLLTAAAVAFSHENPLDSTERTHTANAIAGGMFDGAQGDSLVGFAGKDLAVTPTASLIIRNGRAASMAGNNLILTNPFGSMSGFTTLAQQLETAGTRHFPIDASKVFGYGESHMEFPVTLLDGWHVELPPNVKVPGEFGQYDSKYAQNGRELVVTRILTGARGSDAR